MYGPISYPQLPVNPYDIDQTIENLKLSNLGLTTNNISHNN